MPVRGVLFDLYGTLIDIETDESSTEVYETVAAYLSYRGVCVDACVVRDGYWRALETQKRESGETYPEVDVEAAWSSLLLHEGVRAHPARRTLARTLAQLFRVLSRRRFRPFPGAAELLGTLRTDRRLGVVSDAQTCYALPEMKALGLDACFDAVILSASYGFRKPDERLFGEALKRLGLRSGDAVYVGNDPENDVLGAHRSGIRAVLVHAGSGGNAPEEPLQERKGVREAPDCIARDLADVLKKIEELSAAPLD